MALFHWSRTLETGIATIDAQHKKLLDLLNGVHEIMVEQRDTKELKKIFSELVEYTELHHSHEEELFGWHYFPFSAQHKLEHRELKNMLAEHMRKFDSGKMETFDFLAFLVDWVQDHIIESDQVFGRFLTAKLNP